MAGKMDSPRESTLLEEHITLTPEPSITSTREDNMQQPLSTFASSFSPASTAAHLAAEGLPMGKAQRAWDRRPQSPFSRRRLKVGKVWKRAATQHPSSSSGYNVHIRDGIASPMKAVKKLRVESGDAHVADWEARGSPGVRRIVTRAGARETGEELEELSEDEEVADAFEQANGTTIEVFNEDGSLAELNEDEEDEWEEVDELQHDVEFDQTLMHLGEAVAHAESTRDVNEAAATSQPPEPAIKNIVSTPVICSPEHEERETEQDLGTVTLSPERGGLMGSEPAHVAPILLAPPVILPDGFVSPAKERRRRPISLVKQQQASRRQTLPPAFISARVSKQSWTPDPAQNDLAIATQEPATCEEKATCATEPRPEAHFEDPAEEDVDEAALDPEVPSVPSPARGEDALGKSAEDHVVDTEAGDDLAQRAAESQIEEADISTGILRTAADQVTPSTPIHDTAADEASPSTPVNDAAADEASPSTPVHDTAAPEAPPQTPVHDTAAPEAAPPQTPVHDEAIYSTSPAKTPLAVRLSPDKAPYSPIPSIGGQHPRLPLRRSPRRQLTSPLKRSIIHPAVDRPHLIAFTPIRLPTTARREHEAILSNSPAVLEKSPFITHIADAPLQLPDVDRLASPTPSQQNEPGQIPQLEPSLSAPSNGLPPTPQKPRQPRISDDTALLQAFLKRADESKSSRRMSVTRRESMENRRDSGSVRLALAGAAQTSPDAVPDDHIATAQADSVLADLDPNSSSPRKHAAVVGAVASPGLNGKPTSQDADDALQSPDERATRRSGRAKRRAQVLSDPTIALPNKIPIKSGADSVILKKTEAQELAALTRTNTKKNKAGAILPPLRLNRIAAEKLLAEDHGAEPKEEEPIQTIRWAETLASFFEEKDRDLECSALNDEVALQTQLTAECNAANEVANAVPASETPSKPRVRRLKPPKPTASTVVRAVPASEETGNEAPAPSETERLKPTKRSNSRLATPAKPRTASKLADDTMETTMNPVNPAKEDVPLPAKREVTKRKPAASKLPAPVSSVYLSTGYAPPGKSSSHTVEPTFTISSPPKKRTRTPSAAAAASSARSTGVPKFELPHPTESGAPTSVLGLASPAKKARRTATAAGFGAAAPLGDDGRGDALAMPGLGSPAKKRSRRVGGL